MVTYRPVLVLKKYIVSSSNNRFYIRLHSNTPFYSENNAESIAVLNDTIIQYLAPNTKSMGGGNHSPLVADVAKISLIHVARWLKAVIN